MCTIMTFDKDTFAANAPAILERIRMDAISNPDGFSLVMCRVDGSLSVGSMDIDVITTLLTTVSFARFWLHCRAATGQDIGVAYTHNFRTKDGYLIQHNGVIQNPDSLPVDSMRIAQLVDMLGGMDYAIDYLNNTESFFNTFFIEPECGEYTVVRLQSGTLFKDGKGNYSTKSINGLATIPVPSGYCETHSGCIELLKPVISSYSDSAGDYWRSQHSVYGTDSYADNDKYNYGTASWASAKFYGKLDRGEYLRHPEHFLDEYMDAGEPNLTIRDLDMVPGVYIDDVFVLTGKTKTEVV